MAMSGEFSWEKYWQHKKQSMKTSAITAAVFVSVSYLKNLKRLKSFKKAWAFQQLTGAQKSHNAAGALSTAANIGKYVGKEIAKTLIQTGLAELASISIDAMLDIISNIYESELRKSITESVKDQWSTVEMLEIFRITEGKNSMTIINDCISRKLQNLSEDGIWKNFTRRCGPVIQGLGKALTDVKGTKGTIINILTTRAPALINLGININDICVMISNFIKSLVNDLKDTKKSLKNTNIKYELTDVQKNDFQKFQKEKLDQVSNCLMENYNQKRKSGIFAPVLNYASNMMINKGIEYIAGMGRIERLANTFELIHAASNPTDTKIQYADDLAIYVAEAGPVDMKKVKIDPKDIYPVNGNRESLAKQYELFGDEVQTFVDKDGNIYVRIPVPLEYCKSVEGDKSAGLHEQQKIDEVLGCQVTKGENKDGEQQCTLKREGGKEVKFVIKDNGDGTKHAELVIDGKSKHIDTNSQNKNDCYYNVVLVANAMSEGKSYEEAKTILDDGSAVKDLRKNVSSAIKNDEKLLDEFRWTNRTDLKAHFNSLTGLRVNRQYKNLELSDDDAKFLRQWINRDNKDRPVKYECQEGLKGVDEYGNELKLSWLHLVKWDEVVKTIKGDIANLTDDQFKAKMETFLNDSGNQVNKEYILHEMRQTRRDQDLTKHNTQKDKYILRQSIVWNPNIVFPGPSGSIRQNDPDHDTSGTIQGNKNDTELRSRFHSETPNYPDRMSNMLERIASMDVRTRGRHVWTRDTSDPRKKFIFKELENIIGNPYVDLTRKKDPKKLNLRTGEWI